jgi:hypothetical protein
MMAVRIGRDQVPMLMQFDNGDDASGGGGGPMTLPDGFSGPSEGDLVLALSAAVVSADGRMSDLRLMSRRTGSEPNCCSMNSKVCAPSRKRPGPADASAS